MKHDSKFVKSLLWSFRRIIYHYNDNDGSHLNFLQQGDIAQLVMESSGVSESDLTRFFAGWRADTDNEGLLKIRGNQYHNSPNGATAKKEGWDVVTSVERLLIAIFHSYCEPKKYMIHLLLDRTSVPPEGRADLIEGLERTFEGLFHKQDENGLYFAQDHLSQLLWGRKLIYGLNRMYNAGTINQFMTDALGREVDLGRRISKDYKDSQTSILDIYNRIKEGSLNAKNSGLRKTDLITLLNYLGTTKEDMEFLLSHVSLRTPRTKTKRGAIQNFFPDNPEPRTNKSASPPNKTDNTPLGRPQVDYMSLPDPALHSKFLCNQRNLSGENICLDVITNHTSFQYKGQSYRIRDVYLNQVSDELMFECQDNKGSIMYVTKAGLEVKMVEDRRTYKLVAQPRLKIIKTDTKLPDGALWVTGSAETQAINWLHLHNNMPCTKKGKTLCRDSIACFGLSRPEEGFYKPFGRREYLTQSSGQIPLSFGDVETVSPYGEDVKRARRARS